MNKQKVLPFRIGNCLLIVVMMHLASGLVFSQQRHILLDDEKVQVTRFEIALNQAYTLTEDEGVWVALDSLVFTANKGDEEGKRIVRAGESALVHAGVSVEFRAGRNKAGHLLLVQPKTVHQELTVSRLNLIKTLEDASDRNVTLLIALSDCHFRDTRNLGDEAEWIPGKSTDFAMKAGSVKWLRPGIHHFKNLGSSAARMISIEW